MKKCSKQSEDEQLDKKRVGYHKKKNIPRVKVDSGDRDLQEKNQILLSF